MRSRRMLRASGCNSRPGGCSTSEVCVHHKVIFTLEKTHHLQSIFDLSLSYLLVFSFSFVVSGVPHPSGMIAEELPSWLNAPVLARLLDLEVFESGPPDQVRSG